MYRTNTLSSYLFSTLLSFLSCGCHVQGHPSQLHTHTRRFYDKIEIQVDEKKHDLQFFNFVTRPDIDAPRWDVKIYDRDALAPGYWFMAPYGIVEQTDHKKPYVGPHIYDENGELVWSGAPMLDNYAVFDFKVSHVGGKDMLTMINQHENIATIIDNNYQVNNTIHFGEPGSMDKKEVNMHDFQIVDNGTHALVFNRDRKKLSRADSASIGYRGMCTVEYPGFQETDLRTGEVLFKWSPETHIDIKETYMEHEGCGRDGWDYLHSNSIEKLPDGDYLMSGRRTYALYKISHKDGSIIWRLGGKKSDFEWIGVGHFLGQHDARFHSQNETHMVVSMMDNAYGPGKPKVNNDCSRGLVVALRIDTTPMTAQVVSHFDHPHGGYATARGNFQTLSNGNAFLGWTDKALQSEHRPDGKVIMEASIPSGLKSYRNYKFPWVGNPQMPPDVHSAAVMMGKGVTTIVHVSWNGATEVASWNLYKTNAKGDDEASELVASGMRQGFETALTYSGYATYVIVEAINSAGEPIGVSRVVTTMSPSDQLNPDVIQEAQWVQSHSKLNTDGYSKFGNSKSWKTAAGSLFTNPIFTFFCGMVFALAAVLSSWAFWRARWTQKMTFPWRREPQLYNPLFDGDEDVESEEWDKDEKSAIPSVVVISCDD